MAPARVSRLPLRARLVAGFAATMLLLLTIAGGFVYWRVQVALDGSLDDGLERAAGVLAPEVTAAGSLPAGSAALTTVDGAQILAADGTLLGGDGRLGTTPVLDAGQVAAARSEPVGADLGKLLPIAQRPLRLYAVQVAPDGPGAAQVLVVALRRDQRDEALRELLAQLSLAGLGALAVSSLVGYLLARAALRPVEVYRSRAEHIAAGASDVRLDVPEDRDDEITRLGHTLNDMLDAQGEALDRERRFVDDASHELRTPLTLLTSRVQLMLRRPRTVGEHEAALHEISEDLDRLTRLSDELLDLGAAEGGGPAAGPADLAAGAARAVSARLELAAEGSPWRTPGALTLAATPPVTVGVSENDVARILDNLLENAAHHGAVPVHVAVAVVDGWARLSVADAGPGMPAELLAGATERFARSPEARSRPGAGLGLSLVTSLVTAAGGQVRLCFRGRHEVSGAAAPVACAHDDGMVVTVLLPTSPQV